MYLQLKLPWYSLYDEMIPAANNAMVSPPLANEKSIGQMMGCDCMTTQQWAILIAGIACMG